MASREKFVRLCSEIDVFMPLISKFVVGAKIQKVEYERVGLIFFCCGCIGHKDNFCDNFENCFKQ